MLYISDADATGGLILNKKLHCCTPFKTWGSLLVISNEVSLLLKKEPAKTGSAMLNPLITASFTLLIIVGSLQSILLSQPDKARGIDKNKIFRM
ncbi:TPA: hypothetical protein L2X12_005298 [Escherichia coli]|nr:hypothetical protein [Escherichia coli]